MKFGTARVRSIFNRAGDALGRPLAHLTWLTFLIQLTIFISPRLVASGAEPEEFQFHSVGARVGFPAERDSEHFLQTEAFLDYNLWRWNLNTNWRLQSRVAASAGWLGGRGESAFIGVIGPTLELSRAGIPLAIEGGSSPTYISRYRFGRMDLGTSAQFTTHIGLFWDVTPHWRVGYRYQHMSNAGIREPNPGFNLHILSIGYLF
jgi:hypothetical protein